MYFRQQPEYPFGFGLSFTSFAYSNLRTSAEQLKSGGEITVSVDVRNTGPRAGDEVVQMYVAHVNSKVERPIEELKGFKRIALQPGEIKTVSLPLQASALAYWNSIRGAFEVEPDQVNIRVGSSSCLLYTSASSSGVPPIPPSANYLFAGFSTAHSIPFCAYTARASPMKTNSGPTDPKRRRFLSALIACVTACCPTRIRWPG